MKVKSLTGDNMNCHMCDRKTDFWCDRCGEPVCEDCVVQMTVHNHIDYPLCNCCNDGQEASDYAEREQEWGREEAREAQATARRAAARERYRRPENVEHRRIKKVNRAELAAKQFKECMDVIRGMFGGM